ncbi:MAG: hypothetical protein U1E76_27790 [Planctomycetota bacterium]
MTRSLSLASLVAIALSTRAAAETITVHVKDQFGIDIPGSHVSPLGSAGDVNTGDTAIVAPGTYAMDVFPGVNGARSAGKPSRHEVVTIIAGQTELSFEWITTTLTIDVRDQFGHTLPEAGVYFYDALALQYVSVPVQAVMPISDEAVYPGLTTYSRILSFVVTTSLIHKDEATPQTTTIRAGQTELNFEWITTELTLDLKDQFGHSIPFSNFASNYDYPGHGDLPAHFVMAVSDPDVYPTIVSSYQFILRPSRDNLPNSAGEVQRSERPTIQTGQTMLDYEWITTDLTIDIRDQFGHSIPGSREGRYAYAGTATNLVPFHALFPISDPAVYPTVFGRYGVEVQVALDGPSRPDFVARNENPVIHAGQTLLAFEWIQVSCPLQVVDAAGHPVAGSTVVLPYPFLPFTPGDTVRFPITDNSVYPDMRQTGFQDGYPIQVIPGDIAPQSDTFLFEVLASGAFSPATFVIGGHSYSFMCGFNRAPLADAGANVTIFSSQQSSTTLAGTASDPEGNALTYRWLEGSSVLLASASVGSQGEAPLDLGAVPPFTIGSHQLTLAVSDGDLGATSQMTLTIANSPPTVACGGAGTYQVGVDAVVLSGQVADFDGDTLAYQWQEGSRVLASGTQTTMAGGAASALPIAVLTTGAAADLSLGLHTLELSVSDGVNAAVRCAIDVRVVDTLPPRLAPVSNCSILWPPNHKMVDIVIQANAADGSGAPVLLTATVASSENPDKDADGHTIPDFTTPVIDQSTGTIALQLRAERSGKGPGRTYTITITATDSSGNQSTAIVTCVAPHDRRS